MTAPTTIFLDFNLPNATTWFFFSFLLAVALFFKFSRLLSIRNLDVVMVFLLVPGMLLIQAARPQPLPAAQQPVVQIASLVGQAGLTDHASIATKIGVFGHQCGPRLEVQRWLWLGYLWLLAGSAYFFCRCLLDMTLVQRPALAPNLQFGGLAWFAGTLLLCLVAVAYRQAERPMQPAPAAVNGPASIALETPVHMMFAVAVLWRDWPAWGVAILAFVCHLTIVGGVILIGWRHFQDVSAGMAAATFYLLLPYTGQHVGQLDHVLPMALFIGTLLAYRYPTLAGCLLGVASATTYFPALVLPVFVSFYRGQGAGRFVGAFVLALSLTAVNIGLSLSLYGEYYLSIANAVESAAWQPWYPPTTMTEGFWTGIPWAYRIPVFLLFLSFVIGTLFWPTPKNLAHVIALSCAIFIGLQFWGADQGGAYVLWYLPLFLLLVFRPNLHERVAQPIVAETDWLTRLRHWCVRILRRLLKMPEPEQTKVT